jgi:phosphoglycolate phosphatase-like HAD superfamily hydrolase
LLLSATSCSAFFSPKPTFSSSLRRSSPFSARATMTVVLAATDANEVSSPSKVQPLMWSQDTTKYDTTRLHELAKATNYLSTVKMIVFDKDGTLGNDKASLQRWATHMTVALQGTQQGSSSTMISEFHTIIGWDDDLQDVVPSAPLAAGTWVDQVLTLERVLTKYGHDPSLAADWHGQIELHGADDPLIPNLKEMLIACQQNGDWEVAVCTSDVRDSTDKALMNWNVQDVVTYSICADEVQNPKPNAEPIERLCEIVSAAGNDVVTPQDCIMVGDTISDTLMSRHANVCMCIGVLTGSGTPEILTDTGADIILTDVGHIPALLAAMKGMAK